MKTYIKNKIHIARAYYKLKLRVHLVYLLLIANIVIWAVSYVNCHNFYNDYLQFATEIALQPAKAESAPIELSIEDYVRAEVRKANLDYEQVWAIIQCESRWSTEAIHINSLTSYDLGLWQINSIHKISNDCKLDYKCSTKWAIEKRLNDGNWSAWTCAKNLGI